VTLIAGKHLFRMHPRHPVACRCGCWNGNGGTRRFQEVAKSAVATLRYGVSYAVGNVLPALWGTVMVLLVY